MVFVGTDVSAGDFAALGLWWLKQVQQVIACEGRIWPDEGDLRPVDGHRSNVHYTVQVDHLRADVTFQLDEVAVVQRRVVMHVGWM